MQTAKEYRALSIVLLMMVCAIVGLATMNTTLASAGNPSASFDPQTQFSVSSSVTIQSVYGIATANPPPGAGPPDNRTLGSQTTFFPQNQTGANGNRSPIPSNLTTMQNPKAYSASLTITAQITGNENDGVQWTIKGGTIVINGTTYDMAAGQGEMSDIDMLIMNGIATDANGQTVGWRVDGLVALYGGTVIGELTGAVTTSASNDKTTSNMNYIITMA